MLTFDVTILDTDRRVETDLSIDELALMFDPVNLKIEYDVNYREYYMTVWPCYEFSADIVIEASTQLTKDQWEAVRDACLILGKGIA